MHKWSKNAQAGVHFSISHPKCSHIKRRRRRKRGGDLAAVVCCDIFHSLKHFLLKSIIFKIEDRIALYSSAGVFLSMFREACI